MSQFNWWDLRLQVGVCFNSLPPNISFLLGLFYTKYAPKERETVMRHKKETEEESKNEWGEEQPEDVASRIHKQGQDTSDNNRITPIRVWAGMKNSCSIAILW